MTSQTRLAVFAGALAAAAALAPTASAQEHKELGRMWTYHNPPKEFWQEEYGFSPSDEWLEHVRLSMLRYANFCSASFISPNGLIMTNHHCARGNVQEVTPAGEDWLTDGFFATSHDQEVQVPGLTVQQLIATRDVTAAMNEGITADMDRSQTEERLEANKTRLLETAEGDAPQFEHEVVDLYQGGNYQLYSYKVFDDVRLVAVPQMQIAKFGGDPDNFTYPRFSLDFAMLRAWEDGEPANTSAHYFEWRTEGPKDGELVFVPGNPGSTGRLKTVSQIEFLRDVEHPRILNIIRMRIANMQQRMDEDPEAAKELRSEMLSLENARKAYTGYLDGIKNEATVNVKREAERKIQEKIKADPALDESYGNLWERMAAVQQAKRDAFEQRSQQALDEALAEEKVLEKKIGEAFFAVYGYDIPPDATMTPRIADGIVSGFPMNGTIAPYFTSLYGLYARWTEFGGEDPFDLPQNWIDKRGELDLSTGFNLVSTCDIIGGNSGSAMIDREARVVGLVFDGNIESLGNNFIFTDDVPRTVSVHPEIIILALREVYGAGKIADEIEGKSGGN